ncbi:MAG: sporulation protein YunB [Eubacteriales bacterium]|nr:sporulation protein YunB [Eubacteriales bacterium]
MEKRPARSVIKRKAVTAVLLLLAITLFLFYIVERKLQPALRAVADIRVQSIVSSAMYAAIQDTVAKNTEPLMDTMQTVDQVFYVQTDTAALNRFSTACAAAADRSVAGLGKQGVTIPWGNVSGVSFLAGFGPDITLHFAPEGNITVYYFSEFYSAGINQTLHRIILHLQADVVMVLPGSTELTTVTAEAVVAEHIIVGKVPEAYTDVSNEEDLLNLVPEAD